MKVALYARVSTGLKDARQDPELQLEALRAYCQRHDWQVEGEYVDRESGRSTNRREALQELMDRAFAREFDVVAVWKLDRFARSLNDFAVLLKTLHSHSVRFVSITQSIDTVKDDPTSRLMMHVLAAFAEFESELISSRVKAGIARRKSKGLPVGRQKVVLDREKLLALQADGLSIRQIAVVVGAKKSTVERRLKRGRG